MDTTDPFRIRRPQCLNTQYKTFPDKPARAFDKDISQDKSAEAEDIVAENRENKPIPFILKSPDVMYRNAYAKLTEEWHKDCGKS